MDCKPVLVQKAMRGSRDAFDALVHQHYASIYLFSLRHLRHPDDAADATQNAFIKAYVGLSHLKDPIKFEAWLRQIALNECRKARLGKGVEALSMTWTSAFNITRP